MNCRRNQSSSCGCRRLESRGIELSPAAVTKTTRSDPDEGTRKRTKGRSRWTAGQVDHTWVGMEPGWRPGKSELPASWILKCVSGVRWQLGGAPANRVLGANLLAGSKWQSYTLSLVLIFSGISKSFTSMLHGCDRWCCSHILPGTQASSILKTASEAIYEMESFRERHSLRNHCFLKHGVTERENGSLLMLISTWRDLSNRTMPMAQALSRSLSTKQGYGYAN